jgi:hypothetical protein
MQHNSPHLAGHCHHAFNEGVTNKQFVGKLETHNVETVSVLFVLEDKYTREAEEYARFECQGAPEELPMRDTRDRHQGEQAEGYHHPGCRRAPEAAAQRKPCQR